MLREFDVFGFTINKICQLLVGVSSVQFVGGIRIITPTLSNYIVLLMCVVSECLDCCGVIWGSIG